MSYVYDCAATFSVALTFGGQSYAISSIDFNVGFANKAETLCTGALMVGESILIGDAFCKLESILVLFVLLHRD